MLDALAPPCLSAIVRRIDMFPLAYSKQLRDKLANGKALDDALSELRSEGASILQCMAAVEHVKKCGLAQAKRLVHFSPAWADVREANDKFHEELEELARESDEPGGAANRSQPGSSEANSKPPEAGSGG